LKEDAMTLMHNTLATVAVLGALAAAPYARAADPCQLEISGNDLMQYDKPELSAPATCKQITVTLHHIGKLPREAMGHNWVLVNAADVTAVATAGMGAGLANDYVAPGDKRVLAHTKTIGGGETTSVTFATSILKTGGAYQYLCTFPGHNALMHGTFKFG
jgi:azurin